MDHLAITQMWFSVIPLWLLTSVPCCGFEVFSGTMSRLPWLWFSVSIGLVLSNVISPHFSLLRKEISKKKNIEFWRQHIRMYLTLRGRGRYWEPRKVYMHCCAAVVRLGNMVKIYVILLFYFLFKICTIGIFFFFCHWLTVWRLHNVHISRYDKLGLRSDSQNWDSILLPVLSYGRFVVCSCFQNSLAMVSGRSVSNLNENQVFLFSPLG